MMMACKLTTLLAAVFMLGHAVVGSTMLEDMEEELAIADGESNAQLLQQRLLFGDAQEEDMKIDEQYFAHQLTQSSRRLPAVNCTLEQSAVDFFDISVQIKPAQTFVQTCSLADQLLLGNDINTILLNYGVGDAGKYDDAAYIAGVCTAPVTTNRRRLLTVGFIYKGIGGCRPGMCRADNGDYRMLATRSTAGEATGDQRSRSLVTEWFTNTFKPQMEATLEAAFARELVPLHKGCLGTNPVIDVIITGSTLAEIAAAKCATSGGIGALEITGLGNLFVSLAQSKCATCVKIDFNTKGNGEVLTRGAYVKNEWFDKYGLTVSSVGGYSPNEMARIFDTSKPGISPDGDTDLGSPNSKCPGGGPGVGEGGQPGKLGENCKPLGNVLITQETNKVTPDDNGNGGTLTFTFAKPVLFSDLGLLNVRNKDGQLVIFTYEGGGVEKFTYKTIEITSLASNAVTRVIANKRNVRKVEVVFGYPGAIVEINFCPNCSF